MSQHRQHCHRCGADIERKQYPGWGATLCGNCAASDRNSRKTGITGAILFLLLLFLLYWG